MTTPSRTADGDAPTIASTPGADALPAALEEHLDEDLAPGLEVGEYQIESKLGEGGFGTVYRAIHPLIGKKAAIKVLAREYSSNREMVSRFMSEARAVNTIRHTNIIDIFSFGTLEDGRHYFVMELLEGGTLDAFLQDSGPMDPPLAVGVLRGVARALDAAHEKGIVHRDLKPENIFLTFDEEGRPVPKLLDFGIAKLTGEAKAISGHKTRTGAPIGTPQYMSPEQCLGESVDHLCDVYAFGVVAFELLTGKPPFTHNSFLGLMNLQATAERPRLSAVLPTLDPAFDAAIARIMAIDKEERPSTPGAAWTLIADAARGVGLAVDAPLSIPKEQRVPSSAMGSAVTQAADSLATDTKHPATRTITSAEESSGGNTRGLLGLAAVVIAGVVAYVALSGQPPPQPAPGPATTTAVTAPPVEASATSTTTASAAAPAPSTISIRVESAAPSATVFLDDEELGAPPGPFDVTLAEGPRRLVVKAPGHVDATVERRLTDGDRVTLEPKRQVVRPAPGPRPAGKVDGDLEDPYGR